MSESSDNSINESINEAFSDKRLLILMSIISLIAIAISLYFRDWRITNGLILGCTLSIAGFIWSKRSLKAIFEKNINSPKPGFSIVKYFLRYLISGLILGLAYYFNLISIVAALVGLLTFITAIIAAGFIQIFTGLFKREEL